MCPSRRAVSAPGGVETRPNRNDRGSSNERPRLFNEVWHPGRIDAREAIGQLHRQLPAVARDDSANQPQRPADEALRFSRAILLIVEKQTERIAGRVELRFQPGGIEQQRCQLLALAGLGEMMREAAIEVAARPFIRPCIGRAVEAATSALCCATRPSFPARFAQEMAHCVVQPEETLPSEITFEQQREIEKPTQKVFCLEIRKAARRPPKGARRRRREYPRPRGRRQARRNARARARTEGRG